MFDKQTCLIGSVCQILTRVLQLNFHGFLVSKWFNLVESGVIPFPVIVVQLVVTPFLIAEAFTTLS
jgi:hypothetical protein